MMNDERLLALQIAGSYRLITRIFKWFTFALLAFIPAGILAKPGAGEVQTGRASAGLS